VSRLSCCCDCCCVSLTNVVTTVLTFAWLSKPTVRVYIRIEVLNRGGVLRSTWLSVTMCVTLIFRACRFFRYYTCETRCRYENENLFNCAFDPVRSTGWLVGCVRRIRACCFFFVFKFDSAVGFILFCLLGPVENRFIDRWESIHRPLRIDS